MKRIYLILSILVVIICVTACGMSDKEVISNTKRMYLNGYTSYSIGNAIEGYFSDCDVEWTVSHSKQEKTYTVEAKIIPQNSEYIEFQPNNKADILHIKNLYYVFKYDSDNEEVDVDYVYGTIFDGNKLKSFQTDSIEECHVFLNRVFGQVNSSQETGHQSQVEELNKLKDEVRNAKSDDEARKIAGKNEIFPLDLDSLDDSSKEEILSLIDALIETEKEIDDEVSDLYN